VCRRRGMTLTEMAVVVLMVGGGVFLLSGWMRGMREGAKRDLAVRMLVKLDQALARYHRATGAYPDPPSPDSALQATVYLLNHEKTRSLLESLPGAVWRGPGRRTLVDPWGTPLRYVTVRDDSAYVKANNNQPVFIAAGPDRDFGEVDPACIGDNLRSDDPGPEGFRPRFLARDAPADQEERVGQKDD